MLCAMTVKDNSTLGQPWPTTMTNHPYHQTRTSSDLGHAILRPSLVPQWKILELQSCR